LFLHYAFDRWLAKRYPQVPFERYADDAIVHCRTEAEAQEVRVAIAVRLEECGLEPHPVKTKIVYCKGDDRRRRYSDEKGESRFSGLCVSVTEIEESSWEILRLFQSGSLGSSREGHSGGNPELEPAATQ
jgi:hypothetical protein